MAITSEQIAIKQSLDRKNKPLALLRTYHRIILHGELLQCLIKKLMLLGAFGSCCNDLSQCQ